MGGATMGAEGNNIPHLTKVRGTGGVYASNKKDYHLIQNL